ncbi:hypothetical protein BKP37_17860 [Anaerobacillus alkalilacustris]|uniref:DUF4372 domain-containing protein n=1 Tax=Anaerobacillus alkalilacustris TaxID=393763 RepID=A0A1S2LDF9_9BACI|nr:DUF4372 domain-containing protein [Anaerobacillus alkalilacustris]OIJ10406.1 hypothetical protein BKP37_17860 [Anaerobacillus alkalilacustris]
MDKNTIKSTINELLKAIDEQTLSKLINVIDLDKFVKKLTAYKFLQLLIIAQLNETKSLTRLFRFISSPLIKYCKMGSCKK